MKIKNVKSQHHYDFTADMECEHCGHIQHLAYGYDDPHYHARVIPAMTCGKCGKNRAGDVPEVKNDHGTVRVAAHSSTEPAESGKEQA